MLLTTNLNEVRLAGNISQVNIRTGKYGPFGSINLAVDDSYFDKKNNNKKVVKTVFIEVVLQDYYFKRVKETTIGDRLSFEGKLILDEFQQNGVDKTILKVKCQKVTSHTSKAEKELLKQHNLLGSSIGQKPAQQVGYNELAPQQ
jgi:single-stranded DNA-binding protein